MSNSPRLSQACLSQGAKLVAKEKSLRLHVKRLFSVYSITFESVPGMDQPLLSNDDKVSENFFYGIAVRRFQNSQRFLSHEDQSF